MKQSETQTASIQRREYKRSYNARRTQQVKDLAARARDLEQQVKGYERLLGEAIYIEFDQWAIYNNYPFAKKPGDGRIRLFKKNETNQSFDPRDFESVLEAFAATQGEEGDV